MARPLNRLRIASASVGIAALGSVVALSSADPAPDVAPRAPSPQYEAVGRASSALQARFSIFGRERSQRDEISQQSGNDVLARDTGVNVHLAHLVATGTRRTFWVAPSAGGFCLLYTEEESLGPGAGCYDEATALDGKAWQTTGTPAFGELVALIPDGVSVAKVQLASGRELSQPVTNNVLFVPLRQQIVSYSFTPGGQATTVHASLFEG